MISSDHSEMTRVPFRFLDDQSARQREADHRIANSLQLVSALLTSQLREVCDPSARAALEVSVHRVGAIAGIHRHLHSSEWDSSVDLATYLVDLVAGLQSSFGRGKQYRQIHLEADPVLASSDFAAVIGIVVTELVINACKHAYPPDEAGDITVTWTVSAGQRFSLQVHDEGRGLRTPADAGQGLGSRIVELMSQKLGAEARYIASEAGTSFQMTGVLR